MLQLFLVAAANCFIGTKKGQQRKCKKSDKIVSLWYTDTACISEIEWVDLCGCPKVSIASFDLERDPITGELLNYLFPIEFDGTEGAVWGKNYTSDDTSVNTYTETLTIRVREGSDLETAITNKELGQEFAFKWLTEGGEYKAFNFEGGAKFNAITGGDGQAYCEYVYTGNVNCTRVSIDCEWAELNCIELECPPDYDCTLEEFQAQSAQVAPTTQARNAKTPAYKLPAGQYMMRPEYVNLGSLSIRQLTAQGQGFIGKFIRLSQSKLLRYAELGRLPINAGKYIMPISEMKKDLPAKKDTPKKP